MRSIDLHELELYASAPHLQRSSSLPVNLHARLWIMITQMCWTAEMSTALKKDRNSPNSHACPLKRRARPVVGSEGSRLRRRQESSSDALSPRIWSSSPAAGGVSHELLPFGLMLGSPKFIHCVDLRSPNVVRFRPVLCKYVGLGVCSVSFGHLPLC